MNKIQAAGRQGRYLGAQHDLAQIIDTHLFVIGPNNSGSTFLRRSFEASRHSWNLKQEGQHVLGFAGPHTDASPKTLIWNATEDRRAEFADPAAFDWETSRRAWYFQSFARSPDASVFVTSSPPFLLQVAALKERFENARFLFLTRDPYAIAEGILRRPAAYRIEPGEDRIDIVAAHLMHCFERQAHNRSAFKETGLSLRYEDMCADPAGAAAAIRSFLPVLNDYTLNDAVEVKGMYDEPLRDMNAEQIARLPTDTVQRLTACLSPFQNLLADFGYRLRRGD